MGLAISPVTAEQMIRLLGLLWKWNRTYNLTAVTDPQQMVFRHLLDSLALLPYLQDNGPVLDVGTGAGFPGLPLAMVLHARRFDLLDSRGKKTRFVHHATAQLKLPNVRVIHGRVEHHQHAGGYNAIISRAFSSLAKLIECTAHLGNSSSRIFALKGRYSEQELLAIPAGYGIDRRIPLRIPGIETERSLIIISRDTD